MGAAFRVVRVGDPPKRKRTRRSAVAAALVLAVAACGGGGKVTSPTTLPPTAAPTCAERDPIAATTGPPTFPVRADPTTHTLVDARGRPFLATGDAAWSLVAQLTDAEVDQYLAARRAGGYNTLLVNLVEHKFATHAPADAAGDAPFTTAGDFSTPNEAYFAHAERVLHRAEEEGFVVLLAPAYLGYKGADHGWSKEMAADGVDTMRGYGRYVARRLQSLRNVVWVMGGDADAPQPELVEAIAAGITEVQADALMTVHTAPESIPLLRWPTSSWLRLNAVYTYIDVQASALNEHRRSPMPFVLIESYYENEQEGVTNRLVRTQMYQAVLSGATGQVSGNNPMWHFGAGGIRAAKTTWQAALTSQGSTSAAVLSKLFATMPWWDLSPERGLGFVTGGSGERNDRPVAAVTCDARLAVVYLPVTKAVTLQLSQLAGANVMMHWVDPSNGASSVVHEAPAPIAVGGTLAVTPPGPNADGSTDWVLVVEAG